MPPPSVSEPSYPASAWRTLLRQLRPHAREVAFAAVCRVSFRLLPVQVPLLAGALIDALNGRSATVWGFQFLPQEPGAAVEYFGLILAAVALLTGAAAYAAARTAGRLQRLVVSVFRHQVLAAWEHAPISFHRQHGSSALADCVLSDTRSIGHLARATIVEGGAETLRFLYPAIILLTIDPWMAVFPIASLPMQFVLIHLAERYEVTAVQSSRQRKAAFKRQVRENLDGIETVQALGAQSVVLARFGDESDELLAENGRAGVYSSLLTASVWSLSLLALAGSWWAGGHRVLAGEISAGTLVAFVGFVGYLNVPLRRLGGAAKETRRQLSRLEHLLQLLNSAGSGPHQGTDQLDPVSGHITIRDVTVKFDRQILVHQASATFPAGSMTWVKGRSGAGKSTLLRLLAGFEQPTEGNIFVDGQNLRGCSLSSIRRHIVLVPQQPAVFTGTIADNLALGQKDATESAMLHACTVAGLAPTIRALPAGLATAIGDGALRLSSGQLHRLAIARALLRRPRVLLLDEPASALDPEAEAELFANLAALTPGLTIIVVAHALRSHGAFQHVVELDAGGIRQWALATAAAPSGR